MKTLTEPEMQLANEKEGAKLFERVIFRESVETRAALIFRRAPWVAAGAAVMAGALYLFGHKKEKPTEVVGPQTERIAAGRSQPGAGMALDR